MANITVGTTTQAPHKIPSTIVTTHPTDGLPGWGAFDWFRPAGTIVGSPVSGRVERWSGRGGTSGPVYGTSLYVKADSGHRIFLTHLSDRFVRPGQRISEGQPIGRVSPWTGGRPHVHIAVEGAKDRGAEINMNRPGIRGGGLSPFDPSQRSGRDVLDAVTGGITAGRGVGRVAGAAGDVVDVVTAPADAIRWVGGNWDRILMVAAGALLTAMGLYLLARQLGAPKASLPSFKGDSALERMASIEQRTYQTSIAQAAGRERAKRELSGENAAQQASAAREARRVKARSAPTNAEEIPF